MSIIFKNKFLDATNNCPGCGQSNKTLVDKDVDWYILLHFFKIPYIN
jgi:hypothetical protein